MRINQYESEQVTNLLHLSPSGCRAQVGPSGRPVERAVALLRECRRLDDGMLEDIE
jgi:hypothetical protein